MSMFNENLKVLVVGAHPDDVEIGCGGTLLKCRWTVYSAIACSDMFRYDPVYTEMQRAGKREGIKRIYTAGFPNGHVEVTSQLVSFFDNVVREVRPDLVLSPDLSDHHQDHLAVFHAVRAALRDSEISHLGYVMPSLRHIVAAPVVSRINLNEKKRLLGIYKSRKGTQYFRDIGQRELFVPYFLAI